LSVLVIKPGRSLLNQVTMKKQEKKIALTDVIIWAIIFVAFIVILLFLPIEK